MKAAPPQGDPVDRAFVAYFQVGGQHAPIPSNSSGVVTHEGKRYVVLENVNGILAVYRIRPSGVLKRLKWWPAGLEEK